VTTATPEDRVRTVFLGSGAFALPILAALADSELVRVAAVVTAPARPAGRRGQLRSTPVAELAAERRIRVLTPGRLRQPDTLAELSGIGAELMVLADYGRLIPPAVLDMPRHGALNVHPSLLPRHRGAAPVPAAILAGDAVTGVTLMRMDEGLDTGPLLARAELPLGGDEVAPDLEACLAEMGAALLLEHLPAWLEGSLVAVPQAGEEASLTRPLRRSDGRLDPSRPAVELERQVRAYQPWPGSYIEVDGERLIVWAADAEKGAAAAMAAAEPGTLALDDDGAGMALVTVDGQLRLEEVQPAGRRRMTAAEYRRGRRR
jgi:methionyl-tRNA formyltransferase